ncbi:Hypothetical protein ADU69_1991 [Pediococcus damnosus]|nr:Hypothetical protein ADU69_1991 [Pediococcus damnosus]
MYLSTANCLLSDVFDIVSTSHFLVLILPYAITVFKQTFGFNFLKKNQ